MSDENNKYPMVFFFYIYSLGVCKLKNLLIAIQLFNQENINQHIQLIMYKLVLNHIWTFIQCNNRILIIQS